MHRLRKPPIVYCILSIYNLISEQFISALQCGFVVNSTQAHHTFSFLLTSSQVNIRWWYPLRRELTSSGFALKHRSGSTSMSVPVPTKTHSPHTWWKVCLRTGTGVKLTVALLRFVWVKRIVGAREYEWDALTNCALSHTRNRYLPSH